MEITTILVDAGCNGRQISSIEIRSRRSSHAAHETFTISCPIAHPAYVSCLRSRFALSEMTSMRCTMLTSLVLALPIAVGCSGCGRSSPRHQRRQHNVVNPIMQEDDPASAEEAKNIEIDCVSKGSGYGIEQMTARTIDFGCSDAPMKKNQLAAATEKGGDVFHIPLIMSSGTVIFTYRNSRGTNSNSPAKCSPTFTAGRSTNGTTAASRR